MKRALRPSDRRRAVAAGDASWMAVPYLPTFKGTVVLQTRHPLDVIASFAERKFFSAPETHWPYAAFARHHMPFSGDDLVDGMRWWALWNRRSAPHADLVVKLEDLGDAATLVRLAETLGATLTTDAAGTAIEARRKPVNPARSPVAKLSFGDLPVGAERENLIAAAEEFGYAL